MDEIIKAAAAVLIGYGLPGVFILALAGVVWVQRKDNRELQEELKESYDERRKDALAWQGLVRDNTEAMTKIGDSIVPRLQGIEQAVAAQAQSTRDLVTEVRELRLTRWPRDPPSV